MVGLTAASVALVAAWLAATRTLRAGEIARAGSGLSSFAVLTTMVETSSDLYLRVLTVLAALFLVSLEVREASDAG